MRKEKGFEVLDKINLYFSENNVLQEIIQKFSKKIIKDTLAENIVYDKPRNNYTEILVNGETIKIDIELLKQLAK